METSLLLNYLLVLVMLIFMEGILSADNALVLAVMVKPLPANRRPKALFYGLIGAVVLRFFALFGISFLANVWQAQAIGAAYLIFIAVRNLKKYNDSVASGEMRTDELKGDLGVKATRRDFWLTVLKVELADIAFAVDSILAAVAVALALKPTGLGHIGGMDIGQFAVVFFGGMVGVVIMRFAAQIFVTLLDKRPKLEKAAFLLVGWIGIKLAMVTLSHDNIGIVSEAFITGPIWHTIFFGTMIGIALWGWLTSKPKEGEN